MTLRTTGASRHRSALAAITLLAIPALAPAPSFAEGFAPALTGRATRLAVCAAVYRDTLGMDVALDAARCLSAKAEYPKVSENDFEIVVGFIGTFDATTRICKVSLVKGARGSYTSSVEDCTSLEAPTTCKEKVGVEAQKALVRRYPSIAHSFGLAEVTPVDSASGRTTWNVVTTDETESTRWKVVTDSDASASCLVKSVRIARW